mgnify:CR=1 FL=1
MRLIVFRSEPKENVFAPGWEFPIGEEFIPKINFKTLAKFILKKEKSLMTSATWNKKVSTYFEKSNDDGYTGLGKNSLTSRYGSYNLLDFKHPEIKKLKKAILVCHERFLKALNIPLYPDLYIQCWANVMRKGEQIKPHIHGVHPHSYLGGQINVQVGDTATCYINPVNQINEPKIYRSKNEVGKCTIFQSCVPHYTDVHLSDTPRITIAFDLLVNGKADVLSAHKNFRKII